MSCARGPTQRELAAGRHIRPAGEETAAGAVVVAAGTVLTPAHLAVAAVCGHDALPVAAVPRVALLLTGDEVVTSGIPAPGRVRDTFGPTLPAIIARFGGHVAGSRRLPDDFTATAEAIAGCGGDVVVTTGGTGTSAADHLRRVLDAAGAAIVVPSIRMRPGHPALLARLPDGRPLVGLPGNPLAAMMALLTLADPLLAGMTGRPPAPLRTVRAGTALRPLHNQDRLVPYGTDSRRQCRPRGPHRLGHDARAGGSRRRDGGAVRRRRPRPAVAGPSTCPGDPAPATRCRDLLSASGLRHPLPPAPRLRRLPPPGLRRPGGRGGCRGLPL